MNDDAMNKPVIQTPGEKLAGLRLKSGRSLEDLATATKIPLPMLQAIEMDEYHKVSGELYVKSFLRAYAHEVGIEAEEILRLYSGFTGAVETSDAGGSPGVWREEEVQIKRLGFPWRNVAVIAVVIVVITAVLFFFLGRRDDAVEPSQGTTNESGPAEGVIFTAQDGQSGDPGNGSGTTKLGGDSLLRGGPLANQVPHTNPDPALPEQDINDEEPTQTAPVVPTNLPAPQSRMAAIPGSPNDLVISGRGWPVVLRLICTDKVAVSVKKDGDRNYSTVQWSDEALVQNQSEVQAGQGYRVAEGWVAYWGAEDHFSLKMDSSVGALATINGQYRDLGGLNSGQELILNDPAVIQSNLPSVRP